GRFPLVQAISKVTKELLDLAPSESGAADELAAGQSLLANCKRLVLFLAGVAYQKFGDKLIEEQEIVASLSDVIIDTYLGESAVLRTLKVRQTRGPSPVMTDLVMIFLNES